MHTEIDRYTDEANKIRVRVAINEQTIMFKFNENPTEEEVELEVSNYLKIIEELENASMQEGVAEYPATTEGLENAPTQ